MIQKAIHIVSLIFLYFVGGSFVQSSAANQTNSYVRGCYFTNWSQYRLGIAKFLPENILPGLCTHIFYAFAAMNKNFTLESTEWNDDGLYRRILALKQQQSDLKVILSFGGWTFSSDQKQLMKSMVATSENRKKFIISSADYVVKYKFDGLDFDWEYPEADDKENFSNLLKEMSTFYRSKGLLLVAAVTSYWRQIDESYDVPVLGQTLDMVFVMTYDIHGFGWNNVTGFNSPLYELNGDRLSMSTTVDYYVSKGLPKNKIIVGFSTYGQTWTLTNPSISGVGSPGTAGPAGPYTKVAGTLSYYEICDLLAKGATRVFDNTQKVPYAVKDRTWVGYDDVQSYNIKLEWLKNGGYGGAFIWSLDMDDFNGQCGGQKFPLLNTIAQSLKSSIDSPK